MKKAIVALPPDLRLSRALERDGYRAAALHGDKSQDERLKALEAFKQGEVDLLVCTDVAARGLDIKDVPAVFNYDVPFNAEDYVHRIGRTGRAGASGLAVTLVAPSDSRLVADIEKLIKTRITVETLAMPSARARQRSDAGESPRSERPSGHQEARNGASHFASSRPVRGARPVRAAPADPFFDRPYEASASEAPPRGRANLRPAAPCAKSRPSAKCPLCSNPQAACKTLCRGGQGLICPVFARAGKAAGGFGAGQNQP